MDIEADDPLLDSLLDEVLAGRTPPDMTARILQAYAARQYGEYATSDLAIPSIPADVDQMPAPEPPPILAGVNKAWEPTVTRPVVQPHAMHNGRERRAEGWTASLTITVAAAVIGLGITIGLVALMRTNAPQVARDVKPAQPAPAPRENSIAKRTQKQEATPAPELPPQELPVVVPQIVQQSPPVPAPSPLPEVKPQPASESAIAAAPAPRKSRNLTASPDDKIVSFVNAELAKVWKDAGVKPTPAATDAEWCQHVFVRMLGRAPTADEQKTLAADRPTTRREKLVERLLTQPAYLEEFANHWAVVLTNVFLGKNGGRSGPASREDLEKYFAAALKADKSYDAIAEELLTATGAGREGGEAYNPAVNFLLEGFDPSATIPTARVSRVLLGRQLQCAQCHDHPTQDWKQEQFWALDACFRSLRIDRQGGTVKLASVAPASPVVNNVTYETPDGLLKSVSPRFIDGTEIPLAEGADPRRELARLVVDSDDFAKAAVNRIWAQLFDYGFTRPVDDLGPHSSPSASAMLDRLATEFAAHHFDLKRVIRWAVLSEPFARSSKVTDLASKDMPEEGELALFSRFYARPMQAPAVMGALVEANRIRAASATSSEVESARIAWLANQTPASKGGKNAAPVAGPSVLMPGSDPKHRSVSGDPTGLVKKLAGSTMPLEKQVEHLFLAALARPPRLPEQQAALQLLRTAQGNQAAALEDIWWALQNSSECVVDR